MIYFANQSEQKIGGGWSFIDNFKLSGSEYVSDYENAEIYFVSGASMIKPEVAKQAKQDGKKVVLRVDNFLKHTRNGGKGMSRMKAISHYADLVIYQSRWARDFLVSWTNKDGPVILNGVDIDTFKPLEKQPNTYFYSRFNRDDSKNWVVAQYHFIEEYRKNPEAELWLAGKFSRNLIKYNFDFYNKEYYKFYGIASKERMAHLYGQAEYFMYTYYMDACSNSLLEALACDCEIPSYLNYYLKTGGAPEIISNYQTKGRDWLSSDRMVEQYMEVLNELVS